MGLILAGILALILFCGLGVMWWARINAEGFFGNLLCAIGVISLLAGIVLGIFVPVSGYKEPEMVSTTELVSLRDDTVSEGTGRLFYVSISGTNSYTYYVEVDSNYASNSQKAYNSKTISDSNVTIVEDDSYTEAKLVTYVRHGKKSFWTFAAVAKKYEYVFYVPTGTIARDVSLG